ncbi:MAG: A/G-specific adenine glycosylase, partial [Dehalococcoidia bacterium]
MLDDDAAEYFRGVVYANYEQRGRDFPWRHTTDPYHTLVSEMMLQQTQTSRVANKYQEFVERFPNFESLSRASAAD